MAPDPVEDGDGLVGHLDHYPGLAEDEDGFEDEDGCPDEAVPGECLDVDYIYISDRLCFPSGGASIPANEEPILAAIATALASVADVERLAVVGGAATDEPDPESLSRARAEAVAVELVRRGVDLERLEAHGVGTGAPRDADPARDRAVWFVVLRFHGQEVRSAEDPSALLLSDPSGCNAVLGSGQMPRCGCVEQGARKAL